MSKFCLAEVTTLVIGWVSSLLFLAYSQGFFDNENTQLLLNDVVLRFAGVLAFPYVLTFFCCWLSRRFVRGFLLLSVLLTIGSIVAYYVFFITRRPMEDGWIFLAVPMTQTMIALAFSLIVFLIGLVFRPKVVPQEVPVA
jgi:hypothetical protein